MTLFDYILGGILLVVAVFLIVAVLMQEGKSKGMGAVSGGSSDTFFGKTKGKSWDKRLAKITTIVGIVFVVIVLLVYIVQDDADYDKWFEENSGLLDNPVEETKDDKETTAPSDTSAETGTETSIETTFETVA